MSGVVLVVDGEPADWLLPYSDPCPCEREHRSTVRIDGPPPTVVDEWTGGYDYDGMPLPAPRPLRVGDKVTLAYMDQEMIAVDCRVPFATATVAATDYHRRYPDNYWLVTVSDVEALS